MAGEFTENYEATAAVEAAYRDGSEPLDVEKARMVLARDSFYDNLDKVADENDFSDYEYGLNMLLGSVYGKRFLFANGVQPEEAALFAKTNNLRVLSDAFSGYQDYFDKNPDGFDIDAIQKRVDARGPEQRFGGIADCMQAFKDDGMDENYVVDTIASVTPDDKRVSLDTQNFPSHEEAENILSARSDVVEKSTDGAAKGKGSFVKEAAKQLTPKQFGVGNKDKKQQQQSGISNRDARKLQAGAEEVEQLEERAHQESGLDAAVAFIEAEKAKQKLEKERGKVERKQFVKNTTGKLFDGFTTSLEDNFAEQWNKQRVVDSTDMDGDGRKDSAEAVADKQRTGVGEAKDASELQDRLDFRKQQMGLSTEKSFGDLGE